jgi:hypothetical protein
MNTFRNPDWKMIILLKMTASKSLFNFNLLYLLISKEFYFELHNIPFFKRILKFDVSNSRFSSICVITPQKFYNEHHLVTVKGWCFNAKALLKHVLKLKSKYLHALLQNAELVTLRDDRMGAFSPYKYLVQMQWKII